MKNRIGQFMLASFFAATSMTGYALPLSFTVDAYLNSSTGGVGLNTGISFAAGDPFTLWVNPDDLWSAGELPRWSNADGLVGNVYATGSDESGQPAGTLIGRYYGMPVKNGFFFDFGALVGEISDAYFLLGTEFSGVAPATGTLSLYYWDINYLDNHGSVVATIQTQSRVTPESVIPEPGTLVLMGVGLAGLALRQRRGAF